MNIYISVLPFEKKRKEKKKIYAEKPKQDYFLSDTVNTKNWTLSSCTKYKYKYLLSGSMAHKFNKDLTDCYMYHWRHFHLYVVVVVVVNVHKTGFSFNSNNCTALVSLEIEYMHFNRNYDHVLGFCSDLYCSSLQCTYISYAHWFISWFFLILAFTYSLKEPMTFSRLVNYVHGNNIIAQK